jgi:hypothetical protein
MLVYSRNARTGSKLVKAQQGAEKEDVSFGEGFMKISWWDRAMMR